MEEKTVPSLNLPHITSGRAALRRRFSLLDLDLRVVAQALLTPEQVAQWTGDLANTSAPQTPRNDAERTFASPRNPDRRYAHLQPSHRSQNPVDRLSLPRKVPYFLGAEAASKGYADLFTPPRLSRQGKLLQRLSMLSPRQQKPTKAKGDEATGEMVVGVLRELLLERQRLDNDCPSRAVLGRDEIESQLEVVRQRIRAMGAMLQKFDPQSRDVAELRGKLLQLQASDEELYSAVLPWLDQVKPDAMCLHAVDIADLLRSPLSDGMAVRALQLGLDANEVVAYVEAAYPLTDVTVPGPLHDRCVMSDSQEGWAQGGISNVDKLVYREASGLSTMVWKAEDPTAASEGSDAIGITYNDLRKGLLPHYSARNVATFRLDSLLGLQLVPRTEWAVHQGKVGSAQALALGRAPVSESAPRLCLHTKEADALRRIDGALGLLAKRFGFDEVTWDQEIEDTLIFARFDVRPKFDEELGDYIRDKDGGKKGFRIPQNVWVWQDFDHPVLRRQLTRLQWFDYLTGQVDRHSSNYLVEWSLDGSVVLSAIDNDLSFPATPHLPATSTTRRIWLPALPTVIDEEMATAFGRLDNDQLGKCLDGLLPSDEVQYCCDRLGRVRREVKALHSSGRVLSARDDDWGSDTTGAMFGLTDLDQRLKALSDDQLDVFWQSACQQSYLLRDATKQALVLSGRENLTLFDATAIHSYIRDELLKG